MKKLCLSLMALLMASVMKAEDGFSVNALNIPQGGTGELEIVFESEAAKYNRFQLDVQMPDGITCVYLPNEDQTKDIACAKGELIGKTDHGISSNRLESQGSERFICVSMNNRLIPAGKGVIMTVTYKADASLAVGTELTGHVKNVFYNDAESNEYKVADIPFTITIDEARTVLDENSTAAPEPSDGHVDVRVKRTIKANEWSTICLPFDMTTEQLDAAFGEMGTGWMLADFQGVEPETDAGENVVGISINFGKATAIEANHPYLIKVSEAVSSFTVDGVEIDPDDEPSVDKDEYRTGAGTKKNPYVYYYNRFVGSYVKDTEIPELCLFLNGNKFYYSSGATKMKAFRGYFDFYDYLSEVENANSRVRLVWDGQATTIAEIDAPNVLKGAVYNLNGQFMGTDVDLKSLPKGIYTVDGKKIVNY